MESRRYLRRLGVLALVAAQLRLFVLGQECCLQAAGGRAPPFRDDDDSPRLPSRTQAIITSYRFECCGNITAWQTYVEGGGGSRDEDYDISFQVWRPSPTVLDTGCYSLVGENRFTRILLGDEGLVSETPKPQDILTVQRGDVVGYFTISREDFEDGIQLDTRRKDDTVWYRNGNFEQPLGTASDCPLPVGSSRDRSLRSSTNAGPILSVDVFSFICSSTFLPPINMAISVSTQISGTITQPSTTPTPLQSHITITSVSTQISGAITQPSTTATPLQSSTFVISPGLTISMSASPTPTIFGGNASLNTAVIASLAAVGGSALLLTSLCSLVLAITLAKARRRERRTLPGIPSIVAEQQLNTFCMRMQENEAYTTTTHGIDTSTVNTESNLAYKAIEMNGSQVTMPASSGIEDFSPMEPHLYESVTIRSELCSPDEHYYNIQVM